MSQQLNPINNGVVPQVQTTTTSTRLNVLSPQYRQVNNLESRPTEWIPGGRPIYRRLPATSETYQINFYNVVTESNILGNTFVQQGLEEIGYVYVPYGLSINGPTSVEVVASESNRDLLIKSGVIVWQYGKTEVLPTIVNLEVLDVVSGKYDVAYQLVYDDAPTPELYEVEDFALTGLPLNVLASTDATVGWRYPPVNAFLNDSNSFWSNEDTLFPTYAQPSASYIQWESDLTQAYSKLILRCPPDTSYSGTATLSYVGDSGFAEVAVVSVSRDTVSQFFEFNIDAPTLQTGWNVSFSSTKVSIQSITVTGVLTLLQSQAELAPRTTLVMYPAGSLPATVTNSQDEKVPAAYCRLAEVDVSSDYKITRIQDTRSIIHRDYTPVSDWLTKPFDRDLINLYEQVSEYPRLWMSPPSCMRQEYINLETDQIAVEA